MASEYDRTQPAVEQDNLDNAYYNQDTRSLNEPHLYSSYEQGPSQRVDYYASGNYPAPPPPQQYPGSSASYAASPYPSYNSSYGSSSSVPSDSYYRSPPSAHSYYGESSSVSATSSHDYDRSRRRDSDIGKIFVGGLSWDTTDEGLKQYFEKYDKLLDCVVMKDSTGHSRGFGFVIFENPDTVNRVIAEKHIVDDKQIDPKPAISREAQVRAEKMFVGSIPLEVTEEELRDYFSKFGHVIDTTLMVEQESGRSRGFGFVTFIDEEGLRSALDHHPHRIRGETLEVKKALPKGRHRSGYYSSSTDPYLSDAPRGRGRGMGRGRGGRGGGGRGRGYSSSSGSNYDPYYGSSSHYPPYSAPSMPPSYSYPPSSGPSSGSYPPYDPYNYYPPPPSMPPYGQVPEHHVPYYPVHSYENDTRPPSSYPPQAHGPEHGYEGYGHRGPPSGASESGSKYGRSSASDSKR